MDYRELADRVLNRLKQSKGDGRWDDHLSLATWEWPQGVAMYAMLKVYGASKDDKLLEEIKAWYDGHIRRGLPGRNINTTAPMLGMTLLYEITGEKRYVPYIGEWAEWIMSSLPRTEEGGFQHVTIDSDNYMQLWDDTLYMTVLFLARMGTLLGRDDYVQESVRQFLVHIKYLSDPATGLLFHGYNFDGRHHFAKALWGRGNAWFTAGLVDYLDICRIPEGGKMFLLGTLETQAKALLRYQDAGGMWHTLIDDASSYLESSATAGFSYGLMKAARLGYLPKDCGEAGKRGLEAILQRIDSEGLLLGVSAGTCVSDSLDYYRGIRQNAQPYGQSMALLLLDEALKWCKE